MTNPLTKGKILEIPHDIQTLPLGVDASSALNGGKCARHVRLTEMLIGIEKRP